MIQTRTLVIRVPEGVNPDRVRVTIVNWRGAMVTAEGTSPVIRLEITVDIEEIPPLFGEPDAIEDQNADDPFTFSVQSGTPASTEEPLICPRQNCRSLMATDGTRGYCDNCGTIWWDSLDG